MTPHSGGLPTTPSDGEVIKRVIYCSRATFDLSHDDLVQLMRIARAKNDEMHISGMLLYSGRSFLQMLEGSESDVQTTFARIAGDGRHSDLRILLNVKAAERAFPDWTMGFEHLDDGELNEALDGYVPEGNSPWLNPELVSNGLVAERLLTLYARNARC